MRSAEELTARFRAEGRKVTPQRQCIFRALEHNPTHPTAEAVYEVVRREMPTISLKTVYSTLHELASLGEVLALDLGTGTTRFDPNVERPHHHLVCRHCGRVEDLEADFGELSVPAGAEAGFEVGAAEVVFRGTCPDCHGRGLGGRARSSRDHETDANRNTT
jgi:Fe2+ or Zn2+ uptake regulation protein